MRVTRSVEFQADIIGLENFLDGKLLDVGVGVCNGDYRRKVAYSLATLITMDSDAIGEVSNGSLRVSWRWDAEEHLLITLGYTRLE